MRQVIKTQYNDRVAELLLKIGYVLHCKETNQICFHRPFHSGRFPRFHLLVTPGEGAYAIDLHIDQYSMEHKGNHGEAWAYTGVRVHEELNKINELIKTGQARVNKISGPSLGFVDSTTRSKG